MLKRRLVNPFYWKVALIVTILTVAAANAMVEYSNPVFFLAWAVNDIDHDALHSVKAALYAMMSATSMFAAAIPSLPGTRASRLDNVARLLGILLAYLAGWEWLLSETGAHPLPFIIVVGPLAALVTVGMAMFLILEHHGATPTPAESSETGEAVPV